MFRILAVVALAASCSIKTAESSFPQSPLDLNVKKEQPLLKTYALTDWWYHGIWLNIGYYPNLPSGWGTSWANGIPNSGNTSCDRRVEEKSWQGTYVDCLYQYPPTHVKIRSKNDYEEHRSYYDKVPNVAIPVPLLKIVSNTYKGVAISEFSDEHLFDLARFSQVEAVHLPRAKLSSEGVTQLVDVLLQFDNLKTLHLSLDRHEDAIFEKLSKLTHLQELNLMGQTISDTDWQHLPKLRNLRALYLRGSGPLVTFYDSSAVSAIGQLHKLERLQARFKDSATTLPLAKITNLKILITSHAIFPTLSTFKKLERLEVHAPVMTRAAARAIGTLTNLKVLRLSSESWTDDSTQSIATLSKLEELELMDTKMTNKSAKTLGSFTQLKTLNIQGAKIEDSGVLHLAALRNLTSFSNTDSLITDKGIETLVKLPKIRYLNLSHSKVGNAGAKLLLSHPRIKASIYNSSADKSLIEKLESRN